MVCNHVAEQTITHRFSPLLVSIIEVLPKEKKQKEEKTTLIGQCTVDLFPMLTGKICVIVYSINQIIRQEMISLTGRCRD